MAALLLSALGVFYAGTHLAVPVLVDIGMHTLVATVLLQLLLMVGVNPDVKFGDRVDGDAVE